MNRTSRCFFFILLFLCLLLLGCSSSAAVLRVLSLNAGWFPGRSPEPSALATKIHMCQVQRLLVDINPDILLLQEVRNEKAAAELVSVLPDFEVQVTSEFGQQQELVIASRFSALAAWAKKWVPNERQIPPRGLAFAVLRLPIEKTLAVYTVHLKSNYQAEETEGEDENRALRETSARQLVEHAEWTRNAELKPPLCGILIGGDINTRSPWPLVRGERTFEIMEKGGLSSLGLPGIDHFLAWGRTEEGRAEVLDSYHISDHKPIYYEMEMAGASGWERANPVELPALNRGSCIAININTATKKDLQFLPGIGPVLADRIYERRPYQKVGDLSRVHGIGPVRLEKIRNMIYVEQAGPTDTVVVTTSILEAAAHDAFGKTIPAHIVRLIPPGNCPGHFDLKPRMVEKIKNADWFVYHDFQRGIESKVMAVDPDAEMLVVGVDGSYLIPANYRKLVRSIKDTLNPEAKDERFNHPKKSRGDMAELEQKWRNAAKTRGWIGAPVLAAAMQADFCRWLGFDVVGIVPRSDSASPRALSKLLRTPAAMVVDNRQTGGAAARMLGRRLKIPVATLSNFPGSEGPGAYDKLAAENLRVLEEAWGKR